MEDLLSRLSEYISSISTTHASVEIITYFFNQTSQQLMHALQDRLHGQIFNQRLLGLLEKLLDQVNQADMTDNEGLLFLKNIIAKCQVKETG